MFLEPVFQRVRSVPLPEDIRSELQFAPGSTGRASAFIAGYLRGLAAPFHAMAAVVRIAVRCIVALLSLVRASVASLLSFGGSVAALMARALLAILSGFLALLSGLAALTATVGALYLLFWLVSGMWLSRPGPIPQAPDRPVPILTTNSQRMRNLTSASSRRLLGRSNCTLSSLSFFHDPATGPRPMPK